MRHFSKAPAAVTAAAALAGSALLTMAFATPVPSVGLALGARIPGSCSASDPELFLQRDAQSDVVSLSACTAGHYAPFWRAEHFADRVIPQGLQNGVNNCFTLPNAPRPATSLLLVLGGNVLFEGVDYVVSNGNTITFRDGSTLPGNGAVLLAWYRY